MNLEDLRIKIFADGADLTSIRQRAALPYIKGFTTNPTLMRKAGVEDYERWAKCVLEAVPDKPVCFEVLSDDFDEMERQARKIASWGQNVYVKIPITNTQGEFSDDLIHQLSHSGVKVNVTAITTLRQVNIAAGALFNNGEPSIISVFAGRMADAGYDAHSFMADARTCLLMSNSIELLWASVRQVYNIVEAHYNCHIVTVPDKILAKLDLLGKDLDAVSLDTVKQFHDDAVAAGYSL
jgi:transaldolase